MTSRSSLLSILALGIALAGCRSEGELVLDQGVGITAVRTACPAVGVPDYTGDITTFRSPNSRLASDIDVTAAITNVRSTCNESGDRVYSEATFDVVARRTDTSAARQVTLPYFSTVLRGGSAVVTKRVGSVTLNFPAGAERAQASAKRAGSWIGRKRLCPTISASRSPAAASRAIPMPRSTRWTIRRCVPRSSARPSNCWSASS